jgi:phosphatidate cytidylyltransferase
LSKIISKKPLTTRILVAAIIIPLILGALIIDGWPFAVFFSLALCAAVWEYWRMFRVAGYFPSLIILLLATASIFILRFLSLEAYTGLWLSVLVLLCLGDAVRQQAITIPHATLNFTITLSGVVYIGWLGSYIALLRVQEQGLYWTMLVIGAAALADTGGYLFGSLFGKHRIAPSISPKKSWEGYIGGIFFGALTTWLTAAILHHFIPQILPVHGLIIGAVISVLVPFGDLAESMMKRQFQIKDSSHILPGHGGILDRIDSSLWAIVIGYYLVLALI